MGYPKRGQAMTIGLKLKFGNGLKLNLGCGTDIKPVSQGWINVDCRDGPGVSCVFDAAKKFPFADNTFDEIYASHVFEHLADPLDTIMECHRVLKTDGKLTIRVPYGGG
jgi:predicted SAM-dependent methyltransferase